MLARMSDRAPEVSVDDIEHVLESISRLLELKGESPFKVRAYANAARILSGHGGDVTGMARRGELDQIDGIGEAIGAKVTELVTTGRLPYYESLRDAFPPEIFQLFELEGLGARKIKALHDKLAVHSIPRLERACNEGRVAALEGFGEKSQEKILRAIETWRRRIGKFRLGDIHAGAMRLRDWIRDHPDVHLAEVAGSLRRRKEVVHDVDIVAASSNPGPVLEAFTAFPDVSEVISHGKTKASVRLAGGLQCDLRVVRMAEFPFTLAYFTGSKEHNVALRGRALARGWSLNEYGFSLTDDSGTASPPPPVNTEADIHAALGLAPIPPELRENRGEIEAAATDSLPRLIETENLRGTFHNHTNASDGKATLREMAEAARDLGLEYLGIADHSKSSVQAHGLDRGRLLDQIKQITDLNEEFRDDGFHVFTGVECDILGDGSLDLDEDTLSRLDYVVASVHSQFTQTESEMTNRLIRAIQSPHVTMLGHLSGRLLLTRDAYAVNHMAVIEAAAETGTIIELNANPRRLDMDWRWWRTARDKGVPCSINPDAHRPEGLQHLFFGVGAARKGWLRREDVINCQPLESVRMTLAAKRAATG